MGAPIHTFIQPYIQAYIGALICIFIHTAAHRYTTMHVYTYSHNHLGRLTYIALTQQEHTNMYKTPSPPPLPPNAHSYFFGLVGG